MIIDKHREYLHTFQKGNEQAINIIFIQFYFKPEALKSLYRSPGYKKNQLVLCKNYVLQW